MKQQRIVLILFILMAVSFASCKSSAPKNMDAVVNPEAQSIIIESSEERVETKSKKKLPTAPIFDPLAFWNGFNRPPDDEKRLSDLQNSYLLSELTDYFGENRQFDDVNEIERDSITISQLDERFPIEILRSEGYAVYRVQEGGFYFVFFARVFCPLESEQWMETQAVYATFYLTSPVSAEEFSSLTLGRSTARDVMELTDLTEFCFYMNSGTYSFSLLDDGSIMEILYDDTSANHVSPETLVISDMRLRPKDNALGRLASIQAKDFNEIKQSQLGQ